MPPPPTRLPSDVVFILPLCDVALTHARPTAYDEYGNCVRMLSATERQQRLLRAKEKARKEREAVELEVRQRQKQLQMERERQQQRAEAARASAVAARQSMTESSASRASTFSYGRRPSAPACLNAGRLSTAGGSLSSSSSASAAVAPAVPRALSPAVPRALSPPRVPALSTIHSDMLAESSVSSPRRRSDHREGVEEERRHSAAAASSATELQHPRLSILGERYGDGRRSAADMV